MRHTAAADSARCIAYGTHNYNARSLSSCSCRVQKATIPTSKRCCARHGPSLRCNLGDAYYWSGTKPEEAARAFHATVELEEIQHAKKRRDPELLVTLAYAYAQTGDSSRSLTLIREALALADTQPKINYIAAETYEVLLQRDKAIPLFVKALAAGYRVREFERNPRLQALRTDPAFKAAFSNEKAKTM